MGALIESIFDFLVANYALYVVIVMGILMTIIYFVLNLIKKPIKKLTGKIKNEQLRHLANKTIIVLSFGLSALLWIVLHVVLPKYFAYDGVQISLTGAFPVVLYAFVEGLSKPKAEQLIDTIKDIVDDKEVKKEEAEKFVESAETELDDLLK